jgi:hypothetical protein
MEDKTSTNRSERAMIVLDRPADSQTRRGRSPEIDYFQIESPKIVCKGGALPRRFSAWLKTEC